MRQHNNIGQSGFFQHLHSDGGAGHLHQAQDAFLHARATCGGEEHQRAFQLYRLFGRGDDGVPDIHAHRPGHKREILPRRNDLRAADFTGGDQHGLGFARLLLGGLQAVRVFLLIAKVQRVRRWRGDFYLGKNAAVEQRFEPFARGNRHVVTTAGADVQVVRHLAVEQHGAAFFAFRPQIVRGLAAREDRIDPGTDVVVDPVHGEPLLPVSLSR